MRIGVLPKILIIVGCVSALAGTPLYWLDQLSISEILVSHLLLVLVAMSVTRYLLRDLREGLAALEMGLLNLKDGEFSTTLSYQKGDELGQLCELYNDTVHQLRAEKHWLHQRELLLDKVTQSSPEVLFLLNDKQQVIFSNIAARQFFQQTHNIDGVFITELCKHAPMGVAGVLNEKKDGLFTLQETSKDKQTEPETWHMSTGTFLLNNQAHTLFILKQMTRELSRQEVSVWKKVIRVISHELNNSLGPISSMLHSGKILSQKLQEEKLNRVFSTIDDRIKHLSAFVQGYGKFAKLPAPKIEKLDWQKLLKDLSEQWQFTYDENTNASLDVDPSQLEQLLINLLKNAHESGSNADDVSIVLEQNRSEFSIMVNDKGKGIAESVMNSALIPFYSTKATGSGLGLALCREITDAHHGQIGLHNRKEGGLTVRIVLPKITS